MKNLAKKIEKERRRWEKSPHSKKTGVALLTAVAIVKSTPDDFVYLSIQWLATQMGVSDSYITRSYNEYFGSLPSKDLIQRKMELAQHLLFKYPKMSIEQVAKKLHYSDANYFIKAFKKQFNITPHQYRLEERAYIKRIPYPDQEILKIERAIDQAIAAFTRASEDKRKS